MLHTSIVVELLRSQPRLTFWFATLAQAGLWWLVPSLLYSSPPGDLPIVLAVGHEFQLGSYFGPPLAFWLAEIAFDVAGTGGVYLLAQACVVATYYAVFILARAVVGIHHAAFAVLLMVGISAFTAPTPNFGPAVLAMPLAAFALLNLWRAVGERRRTAWFLLGLALGLLLLTTYAGLVLVLAIAGFLAVTRRGRRALSATDPWLASMIVVVMVLPQLIWFDRSGTGLPVDLGSALDAGVLGDMAAWLRELEALLLAHAGLVLLVVLGSKWHFRSGDKVPVFVRSFTDPFGRRFVYYFALVPVLATSLGAVLLGERLPAGGFAADLVLSGLAIIVLAGNSIPWHRPRLVAVTWMLLLVAPPISAAVAIVALPWLGMSGVEVSRPAGAMGRFFAESFERRTNMPLRITAGEPYLAALVALGAPTRPSVYFAATPERSPWLTAEEVSRAGAVVVWPSPDTRAQAPPDIEARFPGLVAEVPHTFERIVQGRLPLLRIGWGIWRPQAERTPSGGP
jgi:hypothetical protein